MCGPGAMGTKDGNIFGDPNFTNPHIRAQRAKQASTPAESTPPLPKSSGDSGLSIRRSNSGSSRKPQRTTRSRAGARKRFKTK